LVLDHFAIGRVFERANRLAVLRRAHDPPKRHDAAHLAVEPTPFRFRRVNRLVGEKQLVRGRSRPALQRRHQRQHIAVAKLAGSGGELDTDGDERGFLRFLELREFRLELCESVADGGTVGQLEGGLVLARPLTEETEKLDGDLHYFAAIASGLNVPTHGRLR